MSAETLAIIDGHYYAYKFHFGMPFLTGPGGRPTGITYAFANLLKDLRERAEITHWVAVFDAPGKTFRDDLYQDYKATRSPTPEPLVQQLPDVEALCAANGMTVIKIEGYEADDVVVTLAKQAAERDIDARILSRDKDVDQVLSARIKTWDPAKSLLRGPEELLAEKGLTPAQVIDYLSMIGDSSDNVPGIDGIGPKTAVKLLAAYGTLDGVLANVDKLSAKQREKVAAFLPQRELVRQLITLRDVADLPTIESLRLDRSQPVDRAVYNAFGISAARFAPPPPGTTATAVGECRPASANSSYRVLTLDDLGEYLASLRTVGRCAIDTETTGLDPHTAELVGISFACGDGEDCRGAAYIPFRGVDGPLVALDAARPQLAAFLGDATVRKFAQNGKYDLRVLAAHGMEVRGLDGDTMLASWLLDPSRESHGIDYLTKVFFGEEKVPTTAVVDHKAGQTMADIAVATVAKYACEDAQCTWRLAKLLEGKLGEHHLRDVYHEQELPIAQCLARIETRGIGCDAHVLDEGRRHLEGYLESVKESIRTLAGPQFNPSSPKQIAELLFGKLKLPVITRTKNGPSTDAAVLEALRHQHELPDLLLQHRMLSKLIGTYLEKLPTHINPRTGRIHTNFKQTGTETGRLSSDGPNLQNIPKKSDLGREIRAAFVPAPGKVFLAADYSQIELRVLAHFSGDPTLRQAFASGTDIHRFVAAQVHDIHPELVTPAQRNAAKAVNFGIIYGQTAFGLSQQLGIPRGDAQRFIDGYFARFAEVKAYIASVIAQATDLGYAQTMAGRRRYIPQLHSSNRNERLQGERIALNSTIQGSAADLIKRAMLACELLLPAGAALVLQIHDELLVEADAACADDAAQALHRAMTEAWVFAVPLVAEVRRGRNWLEVS